MAAGRVVVVSDLPALLENVPECVAVHAVPPNDSQALADKLQFFWENPDERARIGGMSRKWIEENRSWKENGQVYKELYKSATSYTKDKNLITTV